MKKSPLKKTSTTKRKTVKKAMHKTRAPAKKAAPRVPTVKTILVVDDEPDIRSTVKTILEKAGFKIETAQNGDECIQKANAKRYALVLLDIMMPGTPVKTVVEKIRTPIAFLSVVRTTDDEKRALLASPNVKAFIQKPFEINDLVANVRKLTS
jgi:DNA-binding response OmpR family regulator